MKKNIIDVCHKCGNDVSKKDGVWRKYQNKKLILESTYRMGNLVEEKKIK